MATKIVTKNSSTAGSAPLASDLVQGELAVNVTDKRLYTENASGVIVEVGSNPYNFTANHDGSAKLATTSTGIDVTGTVTADGLTVDGKVEANGLGSTTGYQLDNGAQQHKWYLVDNFTNRWDIATSSTGAIYNFGSNSGARTHLQITTGGDISFYEDTGTTAKFFWDASAESLGIGTTSPSASYSIDAAKGIRSSGAAPNITLQETDASNQTWLMASYGGNFAIRDTTVSGTAYPFQIEAATPTNTLYLDSSGNVGIGTSSPQTSLSIETSGTQDVVSPVVTGQTAGVTYGGLYTVRDGAGDQRGLDLKVYTANVGLNTAMRIDSSGNVEVKGGQELRVYRGDNATYGSMKYLTGSGGLQLNDKNGDGISFVQADGATEYMRIDSSGNLLVGKSVTSSLTAGMLIGSNGRFDAVRAGGYVGYFNRLTNDGDIAIFAKDGTTVGSIGVNAGRPYIGSSLTSTDANIKFTDVQILPCNATGANTDGTVDLGASNARFDDIYATNGTIQTSDRNEKQDIEALSEAEQRVAVACKGLLRKFRWKSAVEEKGEDARIHFGIIAQDLQAAFAAEGLDAGDYAMFISTTWTDEETNEEKTRMGVRYSELLAFIIAAI